MIKADAFNRLLYNALLFSPTDSLLGGTAQFTFTLFGLEALSCDNYVLIVNAEPASWEFDDRASFYLNRKSMVQLEKWSRELDGSIHLDIDTTTQPGVHLVCSGDETPPESVPVENPRVLFQEYEALIDLVEYGTLIEPFAIAPERLGKISRLKTEEEYPLDFNVGTAEGPLAYYVSFKMGPLIRGLIAPLDRDKLKKEGLHDG